ncbi:MAG: hypothetical protein HXY46_00265 [Syntrophaceae bacterium]|nr:hypothetical protein [Syntrophaceae bacterium]
MNHKSLGIYGAIRIGMLIGYFALTTVQTAVAQCPPNSEPYKEEISGGQITVHCRCKKGYVKFEGGCENEEIVWKRIGRPTKEFTARSAELVAALNTISAMPIFEVPRPDSEETERGPLPKGRPVDRVLLHKNCQTFFRALGEELSRRKLESWNLSFPLKELGNPMADGIVAAMENAHRTAGKWKKLSNWIEAQNKSNEGAIVIGGLRADPGRGRNYGHLAVVVPMPPDTDLLTFGDKSDSGPLVRDGNEHSYSRGRKVSLSTWGAVRASRAMPLNETGWYLWKPSDPSSQQQK